MDSVAANGSKMKLGIYQFAFFSRVMISCLKKYFGFFLGLGLGLEAIFLGDNFLRTVFAGGKQGDFFIYQQNVRFYSFITCAKLLLF